MSLDHIDPEILSDFINESMELIDEMDRDLVELENDPDNLDLISRIFRALHTIKGSGSFLGLDPLTSFAHAAEDALNELRKGEKVKVNQGIMDLLLQAGDVIRRQIDQLASGIMPEPGPDDLRQKLISVKEGAFNAPTPGAEDNTGDQANTNTPADPAPQADAQTDGATDAADGATPLTLEESKMDLLEFMVDDLNESLGRVRDLIEQSSFTQDPDRVAAELDEVCSELIRTADFFEIDTILAEIRILHQFAKQLTELADEQKQQLQPRALAIVNVLIARAEAMGNKLLLTLTCQPMIERMEQVLQGNPLPADAVITDNVSVEEIYQIDGVAFGDQADPNKPEAEQAQADANDQPASTAESQTKPPTPDKDKAAPPTPAKTKTPEQFSPKPAPKKESARATPAPEQTIRVDVNRLESLLNLVGELVLQKNRVLAMTRHLKNLGLDHDQIEAFGQVASDLDRVTGDLQIGVMKTRLQPLSKLFSRYPRVIRDLARMTGKEIDLVIIGGETEVDKSVLEGLGDPLVHILRNSADHGIETPEKRAAAGKPRKGTIRLSAAHEGSHVMIRINDDGGGINPEKIGQLALERGLVSKDELAAMSDHQTIQLIFAPGFSTAEKVSDLSGRGVGMDVVRNNIVKLNGLVDLYSTYGQGTSLTVKIPLTVAIMQAMMVDVADELYAIPLSNILEIVHPTDENISTIRGQRVMRLRDEVLPLLDMRDSFGCNKENTYSRFAVVVGLGEQRVGLMVSKLIGQQEVVIKPLDDMFDRSGSISGATVNEDGSVSLILDVASLLEKSKNTMQNIKSEQETVNS